MINIIKDVDLYGNIEQYDAILIGTGIYCSMSQGFQRDIMLNYPYVQEMNMETKYADKNKLGTILECKKNNSPTFVLMFINEGNFRPDLNSDYLSYDSLEKCLKIINILYRGKNVASTLLGASKFDGNGDKERILNIINNNIKDINLTIYDFEQKSKSEKLKNIRKSELKIKEVDLDAYYAAVKKRKEEADIRKQNNGHAKY